MVGMWEAYKLFFMNYVNFSGKSSRAEYWWVRLINFIIEFIFVIIGIGLILGYVANTSNFAMLWYGIILFMFPSFYGLVILIPGISLLIRRYRDTGISPWWLLLTVVLPYFMLVLIQFNINNNLFVVIAYIIFALLTIANFVITILPSKK
ncbi:DUF805 domain-containing protein [Apilactobacillus micheneri]|nr:DUF805 domain-containing protein [Apilactobacillus micheneri]TPR43874.1 DUF805 domain-containing protein [Apilactobacillus micheneri]TPR47646.1 DUF805 domain-containing protein [Apilactobacillus micheneri]TPR50918.1 DUF805 domain-containing protein [Apilactobacillus micheneri]